MTREADGNRLIRNSPIGGRALHGAALRSQEGHEKGIAMTQIASVSHNKSGSNVPALAATATILAKKYPTDSRKQRRSSSQQIVIIGGGPRGSYALERALAILPNDVHIHVVEPLECGPGAIYRRDQWLGFRMNTVASQVTAYTDQSVVNAGPPSIRPLTMLDWLRQSGRKVDEDYYPARAEHGHYMKHFLESTFQAYDGANRVTVHRTVAKNIKPSGNKRKVSLASGTVIDADAVLITIGDNSQGFRGGVYPFPIMKTTAAFDKNSVVGVQGLGLTSIDIIMALTEGRGGRFERDDNGQMSYRRSGLEPKGIVAWSRRGMPLSARAQNQKGNIPSRAVHLTAHAIGMLRSQVGRLNLHQHLMPLVIAEMKSAYELAGGVDFRYEKLFTVPTEKDCNCAADYTAFLKSFISTELARARRGNLTDPDKAACDMLRDCRDTMRLAVEFGGLGSASHREFMNGYMSDYNFLCVGPPAFRFEQLQALMEANLLDLSVGPKPAVEFRSNGAAGVISTSLRQSAIRDVDGILDGCVGKVDIRHTKCEFLQNLRDNGIVRLYSNGEYQPGCIEVTQDGYIVDSMGQVNSRVVALGPIAEGCVWYTHVLARPEVNSRAIGDAGRWALNVCDTLMSDRKLKRGGHNVDKSIQRAG